MKTIHIKEAFKKGWELFKSHKGILVGTSAVFVLLGSTPDSPDGGYGPSLTRHFHPLWFPVALVLAVVSIIVQIGYFKILLGVHEGKKMEFEDLFRGGNLFVKYFFTCVLYVLVMAVGFVLLIVPGIYMALKYNFAPVLVIDKQLSIKDAFKESARMSENIKWKLLGFFILMALANVLGAVVLLVGLLVSVPVSLLAYIHVYKSLASNPPAVTPVIAL